MKRLAALTVMIVSAALHAAESPAPLLEFNKRVLEIAQAEDRFLTLKGLRTVTMMHLAAHNALTATDARYESYHFDKQAPDANATSAVVQALFIVASEQYPDRTEELSALRGHWLPAETDPSVDSGIRLGEASARNLLDLRHSDGWNTQAEYQWHPMAPGVYAEFNEHSGTPEGFIFGAGWAQAMPFALERPDQFRSPPPPDIDSPAYTRAYREVKDVGRFQSMTRTPDQTHLALWWKDFAENSHNRLVRDLVRREQLDLIESARLFALLNMGIFDAYVNVFDNKFNYNHWRPYTAIRWAANDGNPDTEPEESWTNTHQHTYAFPSYPSAHGTACAAAQSAIADVLGDDYSFTMRTPVVDIAGPLSEKMLMKPPVRHFESPWDAADECGLSRVYLGIHFRYDSTAGVTLGREIGSYILRNYLRPLKER